MYVKHLTYFEFSDCRSVVEKKVEERESEKK